MSRMDDVIARHERIKMMRAYIQSYIDDAEDPIIIDGERKMFACDVVDLINDMFLYFNEGEELTEDMKVKAT